MRRHTRRVSGIAIGLLLAGVGLVASAAAQTSAAAGSCGVDGSNETALRDVPYGPGADADPALQTLDLAFDCTCRRPLVVFVHGGGWRQGDKRSGNALRSTILEAGYAFASVNYRLNPVVTIEEAAEDVAAAISYLQRNADAYNIEPGRVAVMGHSAGAHLAALVALDEGLQDDLGVPAGSLKAAVLLDGTAYDVPGLVEAHPGMKARFGSDLDDQRFVSPLAHVDPRTADVAFYLAAGPDGRDSVEQSETLLDGLEAQGHDATLRIFPDKGHGAFVGDFRLGESALVEDVLVFLDRILDSPDSGESCG